MGNKANNKIVAETPPKSVKQLLSDLSNEEFLTSNQVCSHVFGKEKVVDSNRAKERLHQLLNTPADRLSVIMDKIGNGGKLDRIKFEKFISFFEPLEKESTVESTNIIDYENKNMSYENNEINYENTRDSLKTLSSAAFLLSMKWYIPFYNDSNFSSLQNEPRGTFIVKFSSTDTNSYSIGVSLGNDRKKWLINIDKATAKAYIHKDSVFPSLYELICHYSTTSIDPNVPLLTMLNNSNIQDKQHYFDNRQSFGLNESLLPLGSINIDWDPTSSCLKEMEKMKSSTLKEMTKFPIVLNECLNWIEAFKWKPNVHHLNEDELLALVLYTHDLSSNGSQSENFYYHLNAMLRTRSEEKIVEWRGYLYYLYSALNKLQNQNLVVHRGIPVSNLDMIKREYTKGRPIYWSGFTSSTSMLKIAQCFAKPNGIIMCIRINTGKSIEDYSFCQNESEILLLPNCKFVVTQGVELRPDGYYYLELQEEEKIKPFVY